MNLDLVVVGAGPAGLTAGMYAARSGLKAVVIEGKVAGGLAGEAPLIENYPGLDRIKGLDLMKRMKEHAAAYVEIKELEPVVEIKRGTDFVVHTEKGEYPAKAVIIATGTTHKKLGVKGEEEFYGKGVSYCPVCDGFFFRNKKVAVVGGGNTAVIDSLYLKEIGCEVMLIHRRNALRAEDYLQRKLAGKVDILWNSAVEEIKGDTSVRKVRVRDVEKNVERDLEVDGIFISVGETPNSELAAKMGVSLDKDGYIMTDRGQRTNIQRVYAAGDVTGGIKQIVVACGEGAVAALSAFEDIKRPYWAKS